jgi:hypothetical protein
MDSACFRCFLPHIETDKKWITDPSSEEAFFIYDYEKFLVSELVNLTKSSHCLYSKSRLRDCYKMPCYCFNNDCIFKIKGDNKLKLLLGRFYNKFPFLEIK